MSKRTLLLVDDSRTVLMQEQVLLGRTYSLLLAHNGREAVAIAREKTPDLILMDVNMPEMDGLAACRELRQHAETRETPIILVTTRGEHVSRAAGFECGCTGYLTKPLNPVDLLGRVRECLEIRGPSAIQTADSSRMRALRSFQAIGGPRDSAIEQVARLAAQTCTTPMAAVAFVEEERVAIECLVGADSKGEVSRRGSLFDHMVAAGASLCIEDVSADARFRDHPFVVQHGIRFFAGAPLLPSDEVPLGGLCVFDTIPRELGNLKRDALEVLAQQVMAQLEVRRLSIRDPETGMFNRRYMEETLERELRRAERQRVPLGLTAVDMEGCGAGDDAGARDELLSEVGALLLAVSRADDLVCRYQDFTFAIIMPGASTDNTRRRAEQIRTSIDDIFARHGAPAAEPRRTSLAVIGYPEHGTDVQTLLAAVDRSLQQLRDGRST